MSPKGEEVGEGIGELEAGAVLTVDLDAIRANYRLLADRAAPTRTAAVVKADAYGLGAPKVVAALRREGCDAFFVAHLAEARAVLPAAGPNAAVYVLNGVPPGAEPLAVRLGAVPVLNSLPQVEAWKAAARDAGRRLAAALHIDTGMSRLGLSPEEAVELGRRQDALAGLDVKLILSHLASAEECENPSNARQLARFIEAAAAFPGTPLSLANSSGILLGPKFHFDLVRAGAALYGINPLPGQPNPMRQAVRLSARVVQARRLAPGDAVGYGGEFTAERPMTVATIGLGYGDGWPRRARTAAFFGAARLPMLGRISMDTMVVDLSSLSADQVSACHEVQLLCSNQTSDDLAAASGTIAYEILTSLGRRFHRKYVEQQSSERRSQAGRDPRPVG
ncbi:MAG TPA: alanine racemase [Mesorhizobium sp.]|nr:alanine racemase [Mesorhizobium sp.]